MNPDNQEAPKMQSSESQLCLVCKKFWGSKEKEGKCSKCYKDAHNGDPVPPVIPEKEQKVLKNWQTKGEQEQKGRCFTCKKKVGLLGIECKCGYIYCNTHRLPEDHECDFDFQEDGKGKLKKDIVKVAHEKISEV